MTRDERFAVRTGVLYPDVSPEQSSRSVEVGGFWFLAAASFIKHESGARAVIATWLWGTTQLMANWLMATRWVTARSMATRVIASRMIVGRVIVGRVIASRVIVSRVVASLLIGSLPMAAL